MPRPGAPDLALMNAHLDEGEVARFADNRTTPEERRRILTHLAECAPCRNEVRAIRRIASRRSWRRGLSIGVPVAAAAVVVFVMLSSGPGGVDGTTLRDDGSEQGLTALAPVDDAVVEGDSVVFRWNDETGSGPYVLTISDLSGLTVHSAATEAPRAAVATSELAAGTSYLWYVDGLIRDGARSTTGVRRFTVRP